MVKNAIIAVLVGLFIKELPIWTVEGKDTVIACSTAFLLLLILYYIDYILDKKTKRVEKVVKDLNRAIRTRNKYLH